MSETRIGCSGWNYVHWREEGDVYVYFNDDWKGFAVTEAHRLKELVS